MARLNEYSDRRLQKLDKIDAIQQAVLQRVAGVQSDKTRKHHVDDSRTEQEKRTKKSPKEIDDDSKLLDIVKPGLVVTDKETRYKFTIKAIDDERVVLVDPDGQKRVVATDELAKKYFLD